DPDLHPRLDRGRRGWPHPPAGRAAAVVAVDAGARRAAASLPVPSLGLAMAVVAGGLCAVAAALARARAGLGAAFTAFVAGYAALLVAVQSPVYDRYALYLVPPLCVSAACGLVWLTQWLGRAHGAVLVAITLAVAMVSVPSLAAAAAGRYPVGSR